jgi:spore germination protein GerM
MRRKRNTLGCLFYVALVLLVLVIFLLNRSKVQEVIEKTGFTKLFEKKTKPPVEVVTEVEPETKPPVQEKRDEPREVVVSVSKPAQESKEDKQAKPAPKARQARLFFIAVSPDGRIQLKGVIRAIQYEDAPLTSALEVLLKGPSPSEVNQGLISLISPETRLRKVYVKEGTAYLDFSESFRFNSLGREGMVAQLKQVVYSSTEFPTVKKVQILIEGKASDYLGPEGVYIGKPLSREDFEK